VLYCPPDAGPDYGEDVEDGPTRLALCTAGMGRLRRDRRTPPSPHQRRWPLESSLTSWLDRG